MDKITIKNASFLCNIGITEEERKEAQEIFINIKIFFDTRKSAQTDNIKNTIDYFQVYNGLKKLVENKPYNLVETIAQDSADYILNNYPAQKVKISVKKPGAILGRVQHAGVKITRERK